MAGRTLTEGEKALAREAFGESIPYEDVRFFNGANGNPAAMAAFRNGNTAITLRRSIYYRTDRYEADFSAAAVDRKGLLIHELTHVWQYKKRGVPSFLARYARDLAACGFKPAKMYEYQPGVTPFRGARIEQQAEMAGDYCVARLTGNAAGEAKLRLNLADSTLYGL